MVLYNKDVDDKTLLTFVTHVAVTFVFALGTTAGADDIVKYTRLSYDQTSYCVDGLQLQHKHTYIASVTAINAALIERNVTAHSDGGRAGIVAGCGYLCIYLCMWTYVYLPIWNNYISINYFSF